MTPDGRGAIDPNQPELDEGFCRIAAKQAMGSTMSSGGRLSGRLAHRRLLDTRPAGERERARARSFDVPSFTPSEAGKKDTEDTFYIRCLVDGSSIQVGAVFYKSVA